MPSLILALLGIGLAQAAQVQQAPKWSTPGPAQATEGQVAPEKSLAYRALKAEIAALRKELKARQFGYFGQAERDGKRAELKHLELVLARVDRYVFALPANCAEYQPMQQGVLPTTTVVVMSTSGPQVLAAPARNQPGPKAPNAYTPRDIYCRPRMTISDELVAKIREAEDAKRVLKERSFGYDGLVEKNRLQLRVAELEQELQQAGVPGDLRTPITAIDSVDARVLGGEQVLRAPSLETKPHAGTAAGAQEPVR